ncbi:MAG: hypothetical protein ACAH17_03830 [Candidatus Paceibacterota bacterium]
MKSLTESLELIVQRKDSRLVIILSTLLFLFLLLLVQNGKSALDVYDFQALPFLTRLKLGLSTLFDISSSFTTSTLLLAGLGSLLGGINLSLAYTYMRLRGEVILHSGLYSGLGLFAAFLGIGCVACGTALLSVLLGFFGFSAMLNFLPYQGEEIGYIGLLILCLATYSLSKKVMTPNVC